MATDKAEKDKYIDGLLGSADTIEEVLNNTFFDIAWSLHTIAEMLIEQQGYVDARLYINGKE